MDIEKFKLNQSTLKNENEVTLEIIEHCYKITAKIVAKYGDAYLPLFESIHEEIKKQRSKTDLKNIAFTLASQL